MGNEIAGLTPRTTTETITRCTLPEIKTEGIAEEVAAETMRRSEAIDSCVTTAKLNSPTAPNCTAKIAKRFAPYTGNYDYLSDEVTVTCTSKGCTT